MSLHEVCRRDSPHNPEPTIRVVTHDNEKHNHNYRYKHFHKLN